MPVNKSQLCFLVLLYTVLNETERLFLCVNEYSHLSLEVYLWWFADKCYGVQLTEGDAISISCTLKSILIKSYIQPLRLPTVFNFFLVEYLVKEVMTVFKLCLCILLYCLIGLVINTRTLLMQMNRKSRSLFTFSLSLFF